jgi:mRNA-degrading endonuclease RelE of RelBE toxin-antitoxin system
VNIYFSDLFLQSVKELPEDVKRTLKKKLDIIADNPGHPSLRTKKIKGRENLFEATITMSIRMTWEYFEDGILLRNIGEHDRTLKRP